MQNGSLIETTRRSGQSVWEFRWRDRTSGKAVYRRIVLGTTLQLATELEAREVVEGIVMEINADDPRLRRSALTLSQLIEHYRQRELSTDNAWKSYATKMAYEIYLKVLSIYKCVILVSSGSSSRRGRNGGRGGRRPVVRPISSRLWDISFHPTRRAL